jgi:predicted nucleotidyltransferase
MFSSKQLRVLEPFLTNLFREYSYKELKGKEKSNNAIQSAIKRFKNQNILIERKLGTSKLYSINQNNELVFPLLELIAYEKVPLVVKKSIAILRKELDKYTWFYSLVIFGSYANNTSKKDSDLDLAVIIPDKSQEKNLKIAINSAKNKSLLNLDVHIIVMEEFKEMLTAEYANLGKEIANKNLPFFNAEIFYKIIMWGINHGFKIVS